MLIISNQYRKPTEFLLSVDEFNNPKIKRGPDAICTLLMRLALLEPGTIQSHPEAGLGLVSRYKFSEEGTAGQLEADFKYQIERYLPQLQGINIHVTESNKQFNITVEIDSILYAISVDTETNTVSNKYKRLSEL